MKIIITFILFFSNFVFCQLNENKKFIDTILLDINIANKLEGNFREEIKLIPETNDTIKIWYNHNNIAKQIIISNHEKGINKKYFHDLSERFNTGFYLTNSLKNNNQEYFYDSNNKRLIIKIYSTKKRKKLNEVQFISDYEIIKNKLPEVKNW
jgi:hypothetical protein